MSGMIAGGWEYVWAAYGVTALFLGGYIATVLVRYRTEARRLPKKEAL
jgi:heme exporter protein CcmD